MNVAHARLVVAAFTFAAAAVAGGTLAHALPSPAAIAADPFDDARHYVVNKENAEALRLIDSGQFPIDQSNDEGWTLLHYAAEAGNLDMVKALLARGADPTLKTKYGSTPYEVASATMVKATLATAVQARTGRSPAAPPRVGGTTPPRPAPARPAAAPSAQSPRQKLCQARWYSSQALCSDSTCKMREYRKWQTCLRTGSYV